MTIAATHAATSAQSAVGGARTQLASNFNDFLRLLTTQLQNQDPTSPLDTNQFTTQLVQFASVEQQIAMNTNLERLIGLNQADQLARAAGLVGLRATVESNQLPLQGGRADIVLPPAAAGTVSLVIQDSAGRTVRTATVQTGRDGASWSWNGLDGSGARRADGAYRITATTAGGEPVAVQVSGTITGATRGADGVTLGLGPVSAPFDRLRSVATR